MSNGSRGLRPATKLPPVKIDKRRGGRAKPMMRRARIVLTDPLGGSREFSALAREGNQNGFAVHLKEKLEVGQTCTVHITDDGRRIDAAVTRARPISAGRYEMFLEVRRNLQHA